MEQVTAVSNLELSLLEEWNDSNPTERLPAFLTNLITRYLHYAYVAGIDDFSEHMTLKIFKNESKNRTVPSTWVLSCINLYDPTNEKH